MDPEVAAVRERIARLEAEIARARRLNAAWRNLIERSARVVGVVSRRLAEALEAPSAREVCGREAAEREAKGQVRSSN